MNLMEHWILDIIHERNCTMYDFDFEGVGLEVPPNFDPATWVYVEFRYDCYGTIGIYEGAMSKKEWEKSKEKGYWLG